MMIRLFAVVASLSLAACGGDPCGSLKCENCDTAGHRMACEIVKKTNNPNTCATAASKPEYETCK
jgi:hypothetical protein